MRQFLKYITIHFLTDYHLCMGYIQEDLYVSAVFSENPDVLVFDFFDVLSVKLLPDKGST